MPVLMFEGLTWLKKLNMSVRNCKRLASERRKFLPNFDHPPDAGYDDKFEIAHQAYRLRRSAVFRRAAEDCSAPPATIRYRKAIESNPKYAVAHYDFGVALAHREQFPQAREQFEAAVRIDPKLAEAHNALGEMLILQGEAKRAVEAYRRAVVLRPDFAAAQANLGSALLFQGRAAEAKSHLERATQLQPGSYEAHLHLGQALARERDRAGAAVHFKKAAESPDPEIRRDAWQSLQAMDRE